MEKTNVVALKDEARQQLIDLGCEISNTYFGFKGHGCSVSVKEVTAEGAKFKAATYDYNLPKEYRDAIEAREFATAAEAKQFVEKALDMYDKRCDELIEGLGKI